MSLKGVELQIAIPKTMDAGKLSEQHQQNVIQQQVNAHEALKKELERKQTTVNDSEPTDKISDDDQNKGNQDSTQKQNHQKKNNQQEKEAEHPYKGHFVDFSG